MVIQRMASYILEEIQGKGQAAFSQPNSLNCLLLDSLNHIPGSRNYFGVLHID